jgi:hypothetical protein
MVCVEETIDLRESGPEKVGLKGKGEVGGGKRGGIMNRVWNPVADRGRDTVIEVKGTQIRRKLRRMSIKVIVLGPQ